MANTKVKFYNLTSEQYKGLSAVDEGGIYFLNDGQGLYVGSKPIVNVTDLSTAISTVTTASLSAVTQVFEATDPTGSTSVDELFNSVKGDATPKEGDIFIVTMTLAGDKQTKAAYTYNDGNWVACAANVDASKVILTKDIALAGSYTEVGNIKLTDKTLSAAGRSVVDVFTDIFDQTINPTLGSNPTLAISLTGSGAKDVGTKVTPKITVTYNQGKYNTPWNSSSINDGTTLKTETLSVEIFNGSVLSTVVGQTSITCPEIEVTDTTSYKARVLGAGYNAGNKAVNNKDEETTVLRQEGTIGTGNYTAAITGYRPWFTYIGTDNTSEINSTFIRSATNKGLNVTNLSNVAIAAGTKRVLVAIPVGGKSLTSVIDVDGMGLDVIDNFTKTTVDVAGAGSYTTTKQYNVWCAENDNGMAATKYNFIFK